MSTATEVWSERNILTVPAFFANSVGVLKRRL